MLSLLGQAGAVGSGGTSQNPGGGGGYDLSTSANVGPQTVGPITPTVHSYGGGVDLGPDITFNVVQAAEHGSMSGAGQVNAPLASIGGAVGGWVVVLGVVGLIAFITLRK